MTDERYKDLEKSGYGHLTDNEIEEGWHWCWEFDGLLVGPGMGELTSCRCLARDHPVYETTPPPEPISSNASSF